MKIKTPLCSIKEIRTITYSTINKLHDLEKPKKVKIIFDRELRDDLLAITAFLTGLHSYFICTLRSPDLRLKRLTTSLLKSISRLNRTILQISTTKNCINKGIISKILNKHTQIFTLMKKEKMKPNFNCINEWSDTCIPFIKIYNIDSKRIKLIKND